MHPDGKFVLGSPRRRGVSGIHAAISVLRQGAPEGAQGVRIVTEPTKPGGGTDWHRTEKEAKDDYVRTVEEWREKEGPLIVRVERIEQHVMVEEELIVVRQETYTWRPAPGVG